MRAQEKVMKVLADVADVFKACIVANRYTLALAEPRDVIGQEGYAFDKESVRSWVFVSEDRQWSLYVERARAWEGRLFRVFGCGGTVTGGMRWCGTGERHVRELV